MAVYNEEQAEELKAFGLNMVDISLFGDEVKTFAIGFTDSDSVTPELQGIVAMDKLDHERLHSCVGSGSMPTDIARKIRHQNSMLERGFSDAKSERARIATVCAKCYVNPATEGILCFDCCGIEDGLG
ncbi:TPA: hypothetical protein I7145_11890 [Vibrio vulnificus]|nr:hypothetical protein [Vibrio vulnificus]